MAAVLRFLVMADTMISDQMFPFFQSGISSYTGRAQLI